MDKNNIACIMGWCPKPTRDCEICSYNKANQPKNKTTETKKRAERISPSFYGWPKKSSIPICLFFLPIFANFYFVLE